MTGAAVRRIDGDPIYDYSSGRGCNTDVTAINDGGAGGLEQGEDLAAGWRVARWYQDNAAALKVRYLIWQGRYWAPDVKDQGGWGRRYTGGGVYDTRDATGGHYDHVHVSFRE